MRRTIWAMVGVVLLAGAGIRTGNAETRIQGAGATFPAPLYAKWVEEYRKLHPDVKVDYQAVGSGAGIKGITDRTVEFGATDAPMNDAQENAAPAKLLHLPTVAGPVVIVYNLPEVKNLTLTGPVIADIFRKKITNWNDPKLTVLNPGVKLPDRAMVVVHRADGSGTTYLFTDFLSKVDDDWGQKIGRGTAVDWPIGISGKGGEGVMGPLQATAGAVGYVEYAYAKKNDIACAAVLNRSGKTTAPTTQNVEAAAEASLPLPEDFKFSITNAPGDTSYPICGYSHLLVYQDLSYMKDEAKAEATLQYLLWCETEGQKLANDLGYARLPAKAQAQVVARLKTITFEGKPLAQ